MHDIAGLKLPLHGSAQSVEGVDIAVAAPEIHHAIPNRRRGKVDVERIGHSFTRWQHSVQVGAGVSAFAWIPKLPSELSAQSVDCVEIAVVTCEIHDACCHRR